jgi:heme exporter protein C
VLVVCSDLTMQRKLTIPLYWLLVTAMLAAAVWFVAFYTPADTAMGPIQKISYLHVPVAINMLLACLIAFAASVAYIWNRHGAWDDLAASAAKVAVVLGSVVLLTGMIWARGAWGTWWTWNPLLTFSLVLWLLYVAYLIVRGSIDSSERRAMVSAVYSVIAFMDVPLVYLSVHLMPARQSSSAESTLQMHLAMAAMFVPVTMAALGLIATRYLVARREAGKSDAVQRDGGAAIAIGVGPAVAAAPGGAHE